MKFSYSPMVTRHLLVAVSFGTFPALTLGETVAIQSITDAQLHLTSSIADGPSPIPAPFDGVDINTLLGANRFYNAGFTGSQTILANIEAGHIDDDHEVLTHASTRVTGTGALGTLSDHATWVGHALGGRTSGNYIANTFERGISPGATLWSGAVATSFGSGGAFSTTNSAVASTYSAILKNGVGGLTANVFNSSWGNSDPTGFNVQVLGVDGLINQTGAVGVIAAGNSGPGANTVGGFAAGYNTISVGALGSDTSSPVYDTVSTFSSRSPNSAVQATSATNGNVVLNARARIDIVAPGQNLTLASVNTGNLYTSDLPGTSFAAPIVAGGAALVVDAGKTLYSGNSKAIDGRVVKAVLMNGADKIAGWDNGQSLVSGVISTNQSLDYASGTGRMNLSSTFDNYVSTAAGGSAGSTDVAGTTQGDLGDVALVGWDYGNVAASASNFYFIDDLLTGGSTFTSTLTWFVDRNSGSDASFSGVAEQHMADLDLRVFIFDNPIDRNVLSVVAESISTYNTAEHLSFALPSTAYYGIAVDYFGANWNFTGQTSEFYGLAWTSVPEPGAMVLLAALPWLIARRRRRDGVDAAHDA